MLNYLFLNVFVLVMYCSRLRQNVKLTVLGKHTEPYSISEKGLKNVKNMAKLGYLVLFVVFSAWHTTNHDPSTRKEQ